MTGTSPYTYFYELGITNVFPYSHLMLWIMSVPGFLLSPLLSSDIWYVGTAEALTFHLPIILADVLILVILARWLHNRHTALLLLYWLSPVLFYINYINSQLDVIPIALSLLALHFLFKERWYIAYTLLGAAIATKFHIVILIPFVLIYIWRKRRPLGEILATPLIIAGIYVAINLPALLTPAFQTIVLFNPEQIKVFNLTLTFGQTVLYVVPAAYILLVLHTLTYTRFNRDTFVMFIGFAFGILTLGITPMPGWYYWIIPFLAYFYAKNHTFSNFQFLLLNVAYFAYFATIPNSDFLSVFAYLLPTLATHSNLYNTLTTTAINPDFIVNVAFTVLQAVLLINVIWLYRRGVEESKKSKLYNMPYLIGMAGDSGSGKSTLATLLTNVFGPKHVALVEGDAMHKWERGNSMWQKFTHLDPRANQLHTDLEYAHILQSGGDVYRRHYDHTTGTFTVPERLESKTLVVFEGLHAFFLTNMQKALDLKIFIKPEDQLRTHWKLKRDILHRGYTREKVLAQLHARAQDAKEYIDVQEKFADITITLKSLTTLSDEIIGTDFEPAVYLQITCDNNVFLEPLLELLSKYLNIEHTFTDQKQIISFTGTISSAVIEHLSYGLIPELTDITIDVPTWAKNHDGVMQLFVCYYILRTLNYSAADTYITPPPSTTLLTSIASSAKNIGQYRSYVQGGGGNVSVKIYNTTMAVKASGLRLEELEDTAGFVGVDYVEVRRFFNQPRRAESLEALTSAYESAVAKSRISIPGIPDTELRPSIETGFHAILDTAVIHTHSVYANILTCSKEGRTKLAELFPQAVYIPYCTPGATLTFAMSTAFKERPCDTFFLENHGLVVTGKTVNEAEKKHTAVNATLRKWLKSTPEFPDTSVTTLPDGTLTSNQPSLTSFIKQHSDLLSIFPETILFPDQVVYCNKIGFVGDNKPITIDVGNGTVIFNVSYKEALACIETLVAWLYIYNGMRLNDLTPQLLPIAEGVLISNLDSEKYRQKLIS